MRTAIAKRPNGKWRARWVDPATGKERAQHFDRKVDAQQFLDRIRGEYASGTYVDPKAGRVTFGDYAERWRAAQFHRPSTSVQLSGHLKRHVLPFFGHRQLASIRKSEVQAWVKGRSADLGPATVEVVFRWVSSIFRAAVDDGLLRSSPCRGVTLPRKDRERLRPPTLEQMEALVDAVPDRYRALLVFAAGTGVRQGEAFGLTADRVDFLRRRVTIDRQLVQLPQKAPVLAPPKTDASRRIVPLPQVVLDALAEHLRKHPAEPEDFVFRDEDRNPLRRTWFSDQIFRPAARAVGLPPRTGFHALRHFYASLLIRHGESVKTVQARLGHASAVETLDTYGHLWPDSDEQTRAAVDSVLGAWRGTDRGTAAAT